MKARLRIVLEYVAAAVLSLVLVTLLYGSWRADLGVALTPVQKGGDFTLYAAAIFKGMVDNPWYSFNRFIGAPTGADLRDYPFPDLLFLLWVKFATLFTGNPFRIQNLTLLLSFPLVTLPSLFVLRRMGVRYSIALVASILFSFLSFHHQRGLSHVLYAVGYFTVPIATLVALGCYTGQPILLVEDASWWRPRLSLGSPTSRAALVAALLIGLSGTVYGPFFSTYCILVAGLFGAMRRRSALPAQRALGLTAVIGGAFAINVAPSLIHFWQHGKTIVLQRNALDAELYGLKITQLLLPVGGHRLPAFQRFRAAYDATAPLVNENSTAYIGLVGAVGFLYLLGSVLVGERRRGPRDGAAAPITALPANATTATTDAVEDPETLRALGMLNLAVLLLGTVGGFGAIFSYLVSPQIRGYNRISVYVAGFSLLALAIVVERRARRWPERGLALRALPAALALVLVLGVLDQTPTTNPPYEDLRRAFLEDDAFVGRIEASIPHDSMVFQLPYVPFPEVPPLHDLVDYALFRPYLHSVSTHWSYGAIQGRRGDQWNKDVAARPVTEMVDALCLAGFAGIYVCRDGYADRAAAIEGELQGILGPPGAVSANGDALFFPLRKRAEGLRSQLGDDAFVRKAEETKNPIFLGWLEGYYPPETTNEGTVVLSRAKGRFVLDNPSRTTRAVTLDTTPKTMRGTATIRMDGDLFHEEIHADPTGFHLVKTVDVPPGEHFLRVRSDGEGVTAPGDVREVYFGMYNPRVTFSERVVAGDPGR